MIDIITLPQAIEEIADAVEALLLAQIAPAGMLEDVATIVLGERTRARPELPAVYAYLSTAAVAQANLALREAWQLPLTLVTLVQEDEPETGWRKAMDYTAKARSVVLENRRLGLAYVNDIVSTSFEPAYQTQVDNRTIYGAAATVTVRFTVFEGR